MKNDERLPEWRANIDELNLLLIEIDEIDTTRLNQKKRKKLQKLKFECCNMLTFLEGIVEIYDKKHDN